MKYTLLEYIVSYLLRLFWLVIGLLLLCGAYVFYHDVTELFGYTFINPYFEFIRGIPFWTYIVLCSTSFSILSIFAFMSFSLYYSIQKSMAANTRSKYYKYFSYLLSNYFLSDFTKGEDFKRKLLFKIKTHLRTRQQRLAFLDSYLRIQENVAVNLSGDFEHLMQKLNMQQRIESLIYNVDFDDKILAMKLLSYIHNHSSDEQIIKYSQSNNFALRTEAYAALIRLMEKDEHLIDFIGVNHNLSMLDINIIVNAVLKNNKMRIDYQALLASQNPRKIMVGLLLSKHRYKRGKGNTILIINFIGNPIPEFNKQAWDALLALVPEEELIDIIIDRFDEETEDVKLLILENISSLESKRFYDFLKSIIAQQPLMVKIEAMKLIFNSKYDTLAIFDEFQNEELKSAYEEVTCMYMNN